VVKVNTVLILACRKKLPSNIMESLTVYLIKMWTYRILTARRTLVHSLFFELIPRGRLGCKFPLPMYLPPDLLPLKKAELPTNDAENTLPSAPRTCCVSNGCGPANQMSPILGKTSRCRTSYGLHNSVQTKLCTVHRNS
jgi:hypothetical protein